MPDNIADSLKNKKTVVVILLAAVVVMAVSVWYGYFYRQQQALANERNSLMATGTIEAATARASFKVAGRIDGFVVDEGDQVGKGQELGTLDAAEIEAALIQAQGQYQAAQGSLQQANDAVDLTSQTVNAAVEQAQATVTKAEIGVTNAKQQYDRGKVLHENGALSDSQMDQLTNAYQSALSDLQAAQGKLKEALAARVKIQAAQSQSTAAAGSVLAAQGGVQQAQAYMDNTRLISPISGYITEKYLEAGEMVNAGTPVMEVTDLKHTYVKVYIDEKKIGRVKLGQTAEVKVDAYPHKVFKGKVVWINDAGQFAVHKAVNEQYSHDIRSYEVKIDLPNPKLELKTGMTASVKILEKVK
jgi:HlyD family secretion protein